MDSLLALTASEMAALRAWSGASRWQAERSHGHLDGWRESISVASAPGGSESGRCRSAADSVRVISGPGFEGVRWSHIGYFVDRMFKGAEAGDLPIEQPTKFEFVLNMKTAKVLRVTFSQSVLLRANQAIE